MIRQLLKRLTKHVVIKRKLPARFSSTPFYVAPNSQLKYLKWGESAFDQELIDVAFALIRADSHVWDVGANVGVFAFAAASLAKHGSVLAVEADTWLVHLLNKSRLLPQNKTLNLRVLSAAVSHQHDIARFYVLNQNRAINGLASLSERAVNDQVDEILVPTVTLDSLLTVSNQPTFIKIDVEGAEVLVLRGATVILEQIRPTIYVEVGEQSREEITALLKQHDYLLFAGIQQFLEGQTVSSCVFNTLAIPQERMKEMLIES